MKQLQKLHLNQRINLLVVVFLFLIFFVMGSFIYYTQRNYIVKTSHNQMVTNVQNLHNLFKFQNTKKQQTVNITMNLAMNVFSETMDIEESESEKIVIPVMNQYSKVPEIITIPVWYNNGQRLQNSYEFVDYIQQSGIQTATIFQKIPQGYLRISTNVLGTDGERATGTYIPDTAEVVRTIENGSGYRGRAYVVNKWHLTAYEPFHIDNKIKGMFYVGIEQLDYQMYKSVFDELSYYESGYPFLIENNGHLLIHPTLENSRLSDSKFMNQLRAAEAQHHDYFHFQWNQAESESLIFFKYFRPMDVYICTSVEADEIMGAVRKLRWFLIIAMLVAIAVIQAVIILIFRPVTRHIKNMAGLLSEMAKGKIVDKLPVKRNDEIAVIKKSVNKLIGGTRATAAFANEIKHGNYDTYYQPLSKHDRLGNALLEMRDNLKKAREEAEKRQTDDERRNWATNGLAHFNDIMRQNSNDIDQLSYSIISNLVNFLKATIGAIYIINDHDQHDIFIEQKAAFAYNRNRTQNQRIELEEGLVGRVIDEGETIYLTEIPNNYLKITSGLGNENPRCLMLVPLKLDFEVFGTIEIASFQEILPHQIEFVERLGENIASTLSTAKMTANTVKLLQRTEIQAKEMQAQEEELRQNLEELQTTQEESERRERLLEQKVKELNEVKEKLDKKDHEQQVEIEQLKQENLLKINDLKRQKDLNQQILQANLDAILIINQNGEIEYFNHAAEKLWGYSSDEIRGERIEKLMPQQYEKKYRKIIDVYKKDGITKVIDIVKEIPIERKDGTYTEAFITVIENNVEGQVKYTAFVRDLTEQNKIENEKNRLLESIMAKELEAKQKIEELEAKLQLANYNDLEEDSGELISWGEKYSLDIEEIDNQHKNWIRIINRLYSAFKDGQATKYLYDIFEELLEYTHYHFNYEEKHISTYNCPNEKKHHAAHSQFLEQIKQFRQQHEDGKVGVAYQLMNYLKSWVYHHITKVDSGYVDCFKARHQQAKAE